jgi:hypothetical protein
MKKSDLFELTIRLMGLYLLLKDVIIDGLQSFIAAYFYVTSVNQQGESPVSSDPR